MKRKLSIDADAFKDAIESSASYSEAAAKLGVHVKTVNSWAKKLGVSGRSTNGGVRDAIELQEILSGQHPQYPTYRLKQRLIKELLLTNQCFECKITQYNDKPIVLELDHIDGNKYNHALQNLRLLCPNCHSQTKTYKSKNKMLKRTGGVARVVEGGSLENF